MGRFHSIEVGNAQLIALQDSWTVREPGGFFVGVDNDDWAPYTGWLDDDGLMVHNFGCFVIRSLDTTILVDTGLGPWPNQLELAETPALPAVMAAAGIGPSDIDLVLFTHLHWDHVGWATESKDGSFQPTFPSARYVIQQKEFDYWTSPGDKPPNRPDHDRVLAPLVASDRLDLVGGEYTATREVVAVPTPGHTPGHVSFAIISGAERAYVLGDSVHKPVQLSEPDWYPGFDLDPVESTKSRHMILDRAEKEGALLAGGHFAFPSVGRVTHVDGRRSFEYVS